MIYKTKQWALDNGFTHHGKFYWIPIWIEPTNMFVAVKLLPLEFVMDLFEVVIQMQGGGFKFVIGAKID